MLSRSPAAVHAVIKRTASTAPILSAAAVPSAYHSALASTSRFASTSTTTANNVDLPTPPPAPHPTPAPPAKPTPTKLPGSNLPPPKANHSPWVVSLVTSLAKMFGYNSQGSTAIRTASDYYDRCAERAEVEAKFFYADCALPPSFQTWFSLTTLHVYLLTLRLRSLPAPLGKVYTQELLNHFFIDVELRIRGPYAVTQNRLVKAYLVDMLAQYRGTVTALDEAVIAAGSATNGGAVGKDADAVLAAALWRNLFGAGWGGRKVGGVEGKAPPQSGVAPTRGPDPLSGTPGVGWQVDHVQLALLGKEDGKKPLKSPTEVFSTDQPIQDADMLRKVGLKEGEGVKGREDVELEFVSQLERLVRWFRAETERLEKVPDAEVIKAGKEGRGGIVEFTRI